MVFIGPLQCVIPPDAELKRMQGVLWCEMTATTWVELQAMARRIGLPSSAWFRRGDRCLISGEHRRIALAYGAAQGEAPKPQKPDIARFAAEIAET